MTAETYEILSNTEVISVNQGKFDTIELVILFHSSSMSFMFIEYFQTVWGYKDQKLVFKDLDNALRYDST